MSFALPILLNASLVPIQCLWHMEALARYHHPAHNTYCDEREDTPFCALDAISLFIIEIDLDTPPQFSIVPRRFTALCANARSAPSRVQNGSLSAVKCVTVFIFFGLAACKVRSITPRSTEQRALLARSNRINNGNGSDSGVSAALSCLVSHARGLISFEWRNSDREDIRERRRLPS